ncbi:hypothetical protein VIC_000539 [Vibrio coralliilyticus ATCC BAA-450]|nr:hypothetical protein VIC_000539 [Vibrio coralliilyticus ATCC BAA-450]ERB65432.1 hypothetical protein N779_10070 [Vibrio coralliilyticus OCN008]QFT35340.1 hypothetical protein FIU99_02760 [Vibrio sp. THAF64]QGM33239.1 hypothetical protein GGC04_02765 [Vibrio sp. THAF191d]QGN68741.1 hypothetical protein GGC03_02760 [Vibrio sp. THAF191c]
MKHFNVNSLITASCDQVSIMAAKQNKPASFDRRSTQVM